MENLWNKLTEEDQILCWPVQQSYEKRWENPEKYICQSFSSGDDVDEFYSFQQSQGKYGIDTFKIKLFKCYSFYPNWLRNWFLRKDLMTIPEVTYIQESKASKAFNPPPQMPV